MHLVLCETYDLHSSVVYTVEELNWNKVPFLFSTYDPQDVKTGP